MAHDVDLALHAQKLTLREAWEVEAGALAEDRLPEMQEFIRREAPLRHGARELLDLLRDHRIPTTVLSGGLDAFIRPVLEREGLDLPVLSETAHRGPDGRLVIEHPFGHPTCRICGICKARAVERAPHQARTVFLGDGSTDRYGAEVADIVFARHRLLKVCHDARIPCYAFDDFPPVVDQMRAWLERGDPLPPLRARGNAASACPISQALAAGAQTS